MDWLNKINPDIKFPAMFGSAALVLSMITGFASGVAVPVVLVRALVITVVFAGIGFGIHFVLKKYVPEVFGIMGTDAAGTDKDMVSIDAAELKASMMDSPGDDMPDHPKNKTGKQEKNSGEADFKEFSEDDFPRVEPANIGSKELEKTLSASEGKLGKHVMANEKFVKYEPKLMAEAVRSMMSKDED